MAPEHPVGFQPETTQEDFVDPDGQKNATYAQNPLFARYGSKFIELSERNLIKIHCLHVARLYLEQYHDRSEQALASMDWFGCSPAHEALMHHARDWDRPETKVKDSGNPMPAWLSVLESSLLAINAGIAKDKHHRERLDYTTTSFMETLCAIQLDVPVYSQGWAYDPRQKEESFREFWHPRFQNFDPRRDWHCRAFFQERPLGEPVAEAHPSSNHDSRNADQEAIAITTFNPVGGDVGALVELTLTDPNALGDMVRTSAVYCNTFKTIFDTTRNVVCLSVPLAEWSSSLDILHSILVRKLLEAILGLLAKGVSAPDILLLVHDREVYESMRVYIKTVLQLAKDATVDKKKEEIQTQPEKQGQHAESEAKEETEAANETKYHYGKYASLIEQLREVTLDVRGDRDREHGRRRWRHVVVDLTDMVPTKMQDPLPWDITLDLLVASNSVMIVTNKSIIKYKSCWERGQPVCSHHRSMCSMLGWFQHNSLHRIQEQTHWKHVVDSLNRAVQPLVYQNVWATYQAARKGEKMPRREPNTKGMHLAVDAVLCTQ